MVGEFARFPELLATAARANKDLLARVFVPKAGIVVGRQVAAPDANLHAAAREVGALFRVAPKFPCAPEMLATTAGTRQHLGTPRLMAFAAVYVGLEAAAPDTHPDTAAGATAGALRTLLGVASQLLGAAEALAAAARAREHHWADPLVLLASFRVRTEAMAPDAHLHAALGEVRALDRVTPELVLTAEALATTTRTSQHTMAWTLVLQDRLLLEKLAVESPDQFDAAVGILTAPFRVSTFTLSQVA